MKKQINYKKEFIEFLRERDLITSFCAGLAHPKWGDAAAFYRNQKGVALFNYINCAQGLCPLVSDAFHWATHPKGHTFWNDINDEWQTKIYRL